MPKPQTFRTLGLIALTLGVMATLGRLLVQPQQSQMAPVRPLPERLQLSGWQSTQAKPLSFNNLSRHYDVVLDAQEYPFHQRTKILTVQLRYVFNTDASVGTFQQKWLIGRSPSDYPSGQTSDRTHISTGQFPELGHYILSSVSKETILDTCINPQGKSTVTREQFLDNRLQYDLSPTHLLRWAIGQNSLLDKRCIWMRLKLRSTANSLHSNLSEQVHQLWTELNPKLTSILKQAPP